MEFRRKPLSLPKVIPDFIAESKAVDCSFDTAASADLFVQLLEQQCATERETQNKKKEEAAAKKAEKAQAKKTEKRKPAFGKPAEEDQLLKTIPDDEEELEDSEDEEFVLEEDVPAGSSLGGAASSSSAMGGASSSSASIPAGGASSAAGRAPVDSEKNHRDEFECFEPSAKRLKTDGRGAAGSGMY